MARGSSKGFSLALLGDKELERSLNALETRVGRRFLNRALKLAAQPVLQTAKSLVPVDTGRLRDSLKVERIKTRRGRFGYRVVTGTRQQLGIAEGAKGYYPFAVEAGYKRKGRGIFGGVRYVAARPYLRPALSQNRQNVIAIISGHLKSEIEKEARK